MAKSKPVSDWKDRDFAPSTLPLDSSRTYPEPVAIEPTIPELPGMPPAYDVDWQGSRAKSSSRLNSAAEKIGGALGSARNLSGKMKSRLQVVGGRAMRAQAASSGIAEQPSETTTEWKGTAGEKAPDLKEIASARLDDLREQAAHWSVIARDRIIVARSRAAYYANEYPVQTILTLAGLAFCAGFTLRVWRANSD